MYLENHLFGNKYYPMTIDPLVTPMLSDAQKKVWGGVQKVGVYWGFGGMLAGFANDGDGLEVELGEPAKPGGAGDGADAATWTMRGAVERSSPCGPRKASVKMKAAGRRRERWSESAPDDGRKPVRRATERSRSGRNCRS